MLTDLRFALRMWKRTRGTTAIIVGSVALAIAAVSTIFSWTEGLILRPLPAVTEAERLVSLKPQGPGGEVNVAWDEFRDWRSLSTSYEGAAAFGVRRLGLREPGPGATPGLATEPVWGLLVSGDYFRVLGVTPSLGRLITSEDTRAAGAGFVAVISHPFWQRRFGGSPDVIGRRLALNGREVTVVGVAAPRFAGTYVGLSFDVWAPLTIQEALGGSAEALEDREFRWLQAFARLRTDVRLEQAAAEATAIGRRLAADYPASREVRLSVDPLDVGAASRLAPLFGVLLGLTVVLLLVVCANVSNLLLAQGARRQAEMAVRIATGARPSRLVRQLLTESALLALVAGGLGALMTARARGVFPALLPPSPLPLAIESPLDARVMGIAAAATLLTLLVFGLAPALGVVRKATAAGLRAAQSLDRADARWRRGLVAAQIAFSLIALATCGMFARLLVDLGNVDRGFDSPEQVLLVTTDFELAGIANPTERRNLLQALLDETRAMPGVAAATAASFVPLGFTGYREVHVEAPGYVPRTGEATLALLNEVGADYFDVMGIPLIAGRPIVASDRAGGQPVAVVNEALAARYGLRRPLGERLRLGDRELLVVGVARDGKYRFDELDDPARPLAYVPWQQWGATEVTLHLRARGEPMALVPFLEAKFASVDPRLPVLAPMTLDAYTSLPLFPGRLATTIVGVLAVGALALTGLGLYGVTRFAVAARRRELGIRMALGAGRRQLLQLLLGEGVRYASLGLAIGTGLAFGTMRVLSAIVTRLRPDPLAVIASGAVLLLIFGIAVLSAARLALRIDPALALRDG